MTREEAIKVLKEYLALDEDIDNEYLEAQRVAIKALEEQANPNSIRINFVGEKEAKEFDEYLNNHIPTQELKQEKQGLKQESVLDKIKAEIKEWYWQVDKQALAKDPCVVDAMVDLFIRTIDKYKESEDKE